MRGRVIQLAGPVARLGNNSLGADNDGTDRHFTSISGGLRFAQGDMHMRAEFHALCDARFKGRRQA